MTNLEWLEQNLDRLRLNNDDLLCEVAFMSKNGKRCEECNNIMCSECQFRNLNDAIDYLLQEHKEPIKLKQWEYDLIDTCYKCNAYLETDTLNSYNFFESLKEKGHLIGIDDLKIRIEEVLNNCEIVSDNYEGFEDCK